MNKTETLHARQEVANELLARKPSLVNYIAERMHIELGKMLADKICDGEVYRVIMEKPHIEIGDVGFNENTSVYRSKISVTPIVMCQDCKYYGNLYDGDCEHPAAELGDLLATNPTDFCSYGERREE